MFVFALYNIPDNSRLSITVGGSCTINCHCMERDPCNNF